MSSRTGNRQFLIGVSRGFAGALIFSLPMLMTMEMWFIGFAVDPLRLAALTAGMLPLLVVLSYFVGFEETPDLVNNVLDACAAYGIAFVTAAIVLATFGVVRSDMPGHDVIGMIAVQAVPGSIGALLAQSQLGPEPEEEEERQRRAGYFGNLFIMMVGALFLSFNVAPTEEIVLIAQKMTPAHTLAAVGLSLVVMHAFVYGVEFSGTPPEPEDTPWWSLFTRYTVAGYVLVLITGLCLLWVFGRTEGLVPGELLVSCVVLGVPSAVGAAAARLIL